MTRLAIVVLFASLMGPAMAAEAGKPAPAQETAAKTPNSGKSTNSSKVIADILTVSGMKKGLEGLPASFIDGFSSGLEKNEHLSSDLRQAMENSAKEAFTPDGFTGRVIRAMKKDYNEKNYQELLADLSTPVARRMAELEAKDDPSPQEFSAYNTQLGTNPLSAQRTDLLHRLDVASRTSDLMFTSRLIVSKGMMRGMAGANNKCVTEEQLKNAEASMEAKLNANKENMVSLATTILAYTYRDVSDADLTEYLRIYEKENSRHIHEVIYAAIVEEYNQASTRMGRGIMKAVKAKRAAMGDQACEDSAGAPDTVAQARAADADSQAGSAVPSTTPASGDQQAAPAVPKSSIPLEKRKGGDVTQCLEAGSKSDKDIAACAEKFRH